MSAGGKDRRRSKRRRRRLPVKLWRGDVEGTGFTADISNTGLMVETTVAADLGSRFHIELQLPEETLYYIEGVVVRKKVYPRHAASMFKNGLGIRFVGLGEAIRAILEEKPEDAPPVTCETSRTDGGFLVDLRDPGELKRIYERDIKHGGVQILVSERPPIDQEVRVTFSLPDPNGSIDCPALVVTHVEEPAGVGLRLVEVDAVRTRLLEIIRAGRAPGR